MISGPRANFALSKPETSPSCFIGKNLGLNLLGQDPVPAAFAPETSPAVVSKYLPEGAVSLVAVVG